MSGFREEQGGKELKDPGKTLDLLETVDGGVRAAGKHQTASGREQLCCPVTGEAMAASPWFLWLPDTLASLQLCVRVRRPSVVSHDTGQFLF